MAILEMKGITKQFGAMKALDAISLSVDKATVHALVGENGAGKSTLMKILSGVYPHGSYQGEIVYAGSPCAFKGIKDSEKRGIAIIHQELALIPELAVYENIFLGSELRKNGVVDRETEKERARQVLSLVGLGADVETPIHALGVGKQQLVEIAKALIKDAQLLILDEPTASLNEVESQNLLGLMRRLRTDGVTCIIISHKLGEIADISDKITVIRDGKNIETLVKGKDAYTQERIIQGMVGREMNNRYPPRESNPGKVLFELKNWSVYDRENPDKKRLDNINMTLRAGEIVGIAGLGGAGRTELALSIFGRMYGVGFEGQLLKNGKPLRLKNPMDAIENEIAYLTEDRKEAGLVLEHSIVSNMTLAELAYFCKNGIVDKEKQERVANYYKQELSIKCKDVHQEVGRLSGGNQQKVALAKWLLTRPELLILDEPTRGIDVGAKYELYLFIKDQTDLGKSILLISSDMDELLGLSDRVYVLSEGRIAGELTGEDRNPERIMQCIMNSAKGEK